MPWPTVFLIIDSNASLGNLAENQTSVDVATDFLQVKKSSQKNMHVSDESGFSRAKSLQLCPTLCDPVDCSPPGSSVHGDFPGKNTGVGGYSLHLGSSNRGIVRRSPALLAYSLPSEPQGTGSPSQTLSLHTSPCLCRGSSWDGRDFQQRESPPA